MKVSVVIPCYNAEKTIEAVLDETRHYFDGDIICCDDCSTDNTVQAISQYDVILLKHDRNKGYGANQKTLFHRALEEKSDIVIMIHGDHQYTPKLAQSIAEMMKTELFDIVCASRILSGSTPIKNGMPIHKFVINRLLTLFQNVALGSKLSEFHSGYRAYSSKFLLKAPYESFSNDFEFDNQMLVWAIKQKFIIGEISCPAKYDEYSSSIGIFKGISYAYKCIIGTFK